MGKVKSPKINYAIPGNHINQQEFEQMISEAEKGPFYTVKEVKTELELLKRGLKEALLIKEGKIKSIPFSELWND